MVVGEFRTLLDLANNMVNGIWKKSFSQNMGPLVAVEVNPPESLTKYGLSWLLSRAPGFFISSNQVKILHEPQSFYKLLLEQIKNAKERIVLASLYLGNGPLEENLVVALRKRLKENPGLRVRILLDCTRGSRGEVNSRKMIIPLLRDFQESCQVSLFHTPTLRVPFFSLFPEKYKEIIGLQHIKVYLFDDNFVITGANLSNDYFTRRQDRYMFISNCSKTSDFIEGLIEKVSDFCFHLNAEDKLNLSETWPYNPLKTHPKVFNMAASNHIKNYYKSFIRSTKTDDTDTIIFPLLEMGPLDIHCDSETTEEILENCNKDSFIYLTTGYFNLTKSYVNTIISKSKANFRILMAHPTANGFYRAKGPAGGIPDAYTSIATEFLNKVMISNESWRVKLYEYQRPGWTYHAKGLWLSSNESNPPFLTMIGSPNFGERSVKRDLECQFLLVTTDESLKNELLEERNRLYDYCQPFTTEDPERKTPFWVEVVVRFFRSYL